MQVILLEDVSKLGKLGNVKRVKYGYANNYLIPAKKAKRATEKNLEEFELRRSELEAKQKLKMAETESIAKQISSKSVVVVRKARSDGKIFGSVTARDIANEVIKLGAKITRSDIMMPGGAIKELGEHEISVILSFGVVAEVKLIVSEER